MADEKATAEAEEQKEKKGPGGFGIGKAILLSVGALLVFILGIPLCLLINGMLSASSPYLVPIEGNATIDSMLVEVAVWQDKIDEKARADSVRLEAEKAVSKTAKTSAHDETVAESLAEPVPAELTEEASLDEAVGTDNSVETDNTAETDNSDKTDEETGSDESEVDEVVGPPNPGAVSEDNVLQAEAGAKTTADDVAEENPDEFPMDPERLKRLVKVYEKMRPKQVALILNTMPERQAATILSGMKGAVAGKVFAEMEPKKAARMSQLLLRVNNNER